MDAEYDLFNTVALKGNHFNDNDVLIEGSEVSDIRFFDLEKRLKEILGDNFIALHRGPRMIPASSDYPEEEVTVEIKWNDRNKLDNINLLEIKENLQNEFGIFIWDFVVIQGCHDCPAVEKPHNWDFD